jgi:Ca2+-transporting ATPase
MSTIQSDAENSGQLLAVTKGAPDVLLTRCKEELVGERIRPLTQERRDEIAAANDALAGEALRTLAVASRTLSSDGFPDDEFDEDIEHELVFLGLIGMLDPPRDEVREAVARAAHAGIRTIMITGDHPKTAAVIAAELGISADGRTVSGAELERLTDDERERTLQEVSVYARVDPGHKLAIVDALQHAGATVAMTGDGVNDAPALKSADIGIAMGITGTDVSREAADIVLTDDNYASIVLAVEEGRAIFANIRKFLRYLLSSNLGEVMTMFFGVLLAGLIGLSAVDGGLTLPLLATQILWINLVTDGAPALALGVDSVHGDVMRAPPRPRDEGVITRPMWRGILLVGAIMATGSLLVLDASLPGGLIEGLQDLRHAQTMTFTTMVFFSLFHVFNARSEDRSAFHGLFANAWVWGAVLLSLALQVAVVHLPFLQRAFSTVPLTFRDWLVCAAVGSTVLWLVELWKLAGRHFPTVPGRESVDNGNSSLSIRRK